jgi:hypothetical protein
MSDLETLTTNNFEICKKYGGGYCVQCCEYDNRYYWPLDTLTDVGGSALCANCLTEKIIPSNYFIGYSVKEIHEKLTKFHK